MSDKKRFHVIVTGRVQGVFFRAYTREEAAKHGLTGWVRNRPDGSVEANIEGEATAVEKMLKWFHKGSPHSLVEKVQVFEEAPLENDTGFEVHY